MAHNQRRSDGEESAVTYGQHEGCFVDHQSAPFRFEYVAQSLASTRTAQSCEYSCGLLNEPGLQVGTFPKPAIDLEETFDAPNLGGWFTSTQNPVQQCGDAQSVSSRTSFLRDLQLPLEVPELSSDPIQDLEDYLREVNEKRFGDPFAQWLPISPTKDEQDDGLGFPATAAKMHSLLLRELECETIETPPDAEAWIEELRLLSTEAPQVEFDFSATRSKRFDAEPVTPPLSPMSTDSHCSPYKPDPKICIIDLTSEPSSPVAPEVHRLEESIRNGAIESDPPAHKGFTPTPSTPTLPSYAEKSVISLKGLVIDVPLTSASLSSDSAPASNVLEKPGILDDLAIKEPFSDDRPVESFFDEAFESTLEAHRSNVVMTIEQERFDPVDAIARIPVPTLDFNIDEPEWANKISDAKEQFRWILSDHLGLGTFDHMPRSAAEESKLRWAPFPPNTGRVSTTEELGSMLEGARKLLVLEPAPDLSSDSFVSRMAGLRIEQCQEEEEELEEEESIEDERNEKAHSVPDDNRYMESTYFKTGNVTVLGEKPKPLEESTRSSVESLVAATSKKRRRRQTSQDTAGMLPRSNDAEAANKLLAGFMELRAVKKPKVTLGTELDLAHPVVPARRGQEPADLPASAPTKEPSALTSAQAPEAIIPDDKASFVISLGLPRTILRMIESSWPQDNIFDRDYTQDEDFNRSAGSTQRERVPSQSSFDADIALTPTVGIIVTTLQKAKQRQLPKSEDLPQLRKRVLEVSSKYETLYVLVSECNTVGEYTSPLHASDAEAYADFVRFTLSLQAGVTTVFVPGNEKTMGKWILSWMCRYSPHALSSKPYLNTVESTWEVFFRRGGMNVFAAQVLAGAVLEKGGDQGLARFMASSQAEILAAFGSYLGGEKGLRNLTKILCTPWAE